MERLKRSLTGKWASISDQLVLEFDASNVTITSNDGIRHFRYVVLSGQSMRIDSFNGSKSLLSTVSMDERASKATLTKGGISWMPGSPESISTEIVRIK